MELKIGGHLGMSQGIRYAVMSARALEYNVLQTMIGNERDYAPFDVSSADIQEFKKMSYGINLYVHLPYVINPCEGAAQRRGFYKTTFKRFMAAAAQYGAKAVVMHPGFKKDLPEPEAYKNLLRFMEETFDEDNPVETLLETDAGSKNGSAIGSAEFISAALNDLDNPHFGMCIDTCHLYARGLDLWQKPLRDEFLAEHHHEIRLVHLNNPDPAVQLGSHLDRHNTPFQSRPTWNHEGMIKEFASRYPLVLERRSLAVQKQDLDLIHGYLGTARAKKVI